MMFDELYNFGLDTLKDHLVYHMMEDIRILKSVSVLYSSTYAHFNVNIKQAYITTFQRRRTRTIEAVDVMEGSYEKRLSYARREVNGRMGRGEKEMAAIERSRPCVLRHGIETTIGKMARAADLRERSSSIVSFASGLVKSIIVSIVNIFCQQCVE